MLTNNVGMNEGGVLKCTISWKIMWILTFNRNELLILYVHRIKNTA